MPGHYPQPVEGEEMIRIQCCIEGCSESLEGEVNYTFLCMLAARRGWTIVDDLLRCPAHSKKASPNWEHEDYRGMDDRGESIVRYRGYRIRLADPPHLEQWQLQAWPEIMTLPCEEVLLRQDMPDAYTQDGIRLVVCDPNMPFLKALARLRKCIDRRLDGE